MLNLFAAGEHGLPNLLAQPEVNGHAITILEAIAAGAAIFGALPEEE